MPCVKMSLSSQEFHQQSNSTNIVLSLNICLCSICCCCFSGLLCFGGILQTYDQFGQNESRVELVGNQGNSCHLLVSVSFKFEFPQKELESKKTQFSNYHLVSNKKERVKSCLWMGFLQSTYSLCILLFFCWFFF